MFSIRQFAVWLQLVIAIFAVTSSAIGCDHCWHHFSQAVSVADDGAVAIDAGNSDEPEAPHVCICSCSSLSVVASITPESLALLSMSDVSLHPGYHPISQSPPLLPPRG